jgi:hypothetical protein
MNVWKRVCGSLSAGPVWTDGPGAVLEALREQLLDAARRLEIDFLLMWRLDRRGDQ